MVRKKNNKNFLPLLSLLVLILSIPVISSTNFSTNVNTSRFRSVLSDSDEKKENKEDEKKDEKHEEKREPEKVETKESKPEEKKSIEVNKKENINTNIKVETKKEVKTNLEEKELSKDNNSVDKPDSNDDSIEMETEAEVEVETESESEFEQETETNDLGNTSTSFKLKIKSKTVNGKTIVETTAGELEVNNNPEDAVNELVDNGVIDKPVEFDVISENNKVEFEFKGIETKKIFGLFKVDLPKTVTIDANTGDIVSTKQNIWTQILNFISF